MEPSLIRVIFTTVLIICVKGDLDDLTDDCHDKELLLCSTIKRQPFDCQGPNAFLGHYYRENCKRTCGLCKPKSVDHGTNLIWAQTPATKMQVVSRLVAIQGNPSSWIAKRKPVVTYISAPHIAWEFKALGFLWSDQLVFWSESTNKKIQSLVLNGTSDSDTIFAGTSSEVHGLAVDWISRNLYFTDAMYNWILMVTFDPNKRYYKIIVDDKLDSPHGLAVHPKAGSLFWSDWGERPRIEKCGLLGENRSILVDRDIVEPRGLALDYRTDTLYWVDTAKGYVESIRIDGSNRNIFYKDESSSFYGLALYEDYVFVTDKERGSLKVFNKSKNLVSFTLGNQPFDVIMYDGRQQPGNSSRCSDLGCEQFCIEDPVLGATCHCGSGYVADDEESKNCTASKKFVHPSHLYAIRDAICQYPANLADMSLANITLDSQCFLEDKQGYTTLTFDARENMLYYFANSTKIISRIPLEIGGRGKVVTGGAGEINGMALDWVSGNLYWTDSTYGVIKVSKKTGAYQKILLSNLNNPFAIAVHPGRGEIYWTDHGHLPDIGSKIEKASMDGTGREELPVRTGQPNHLFVDYAKNNLYWSDSIRHHVVMYNLDTKKSLVIFEQPSVTFFGLSIFKDYVLWTDTEDMNGIHVGRLDNREKVRGIIHPKNGIASDLITFDIQNQPNMNNSCIEGRHKCDHLCLVSNRHYRNRPICHCGAGFKLSVDGMTCTTAYSAWDNFLLVNDAYQKQIFQVDLKSAEVGAINIFPANEPVALTYDPVELKVFWSDNKQNVIKQVTIDGKSEKTLMFFDNSSMCDGLAADYINKLLFFSDTGNNVIGVASMINYDYYTYVVTEDLDEPRDIVISPNQGVIYWSDWGTMPAIERANMDGTKREVVVKLTQPSWPNALALDIAENKLYWVDAQPDTISVIDLATKVITLLVQEPVAHFFSLDVSGDYLFVTDWKKNYLRRMNKNGGALEQFGDATFTRLYGIKVFNSSEAFKGVSVCAAGHCEHLCLPRQNNQYVCRCSVGYTGTASCQKDSIDEDGSIDPTPATDTSHEPPTTTVGAGPEVTSPNAEQWTEGVVSVIYTDPFGGAMMSNETDVSVQTVEVETTLAYKETTEITTLSTSVGSADNAVYAKSTKKDPILSPLVMGVIIGTVVVIVVIVVIIVASLTWRHYKYTPRHGRLIEDKNPTDFYTIAFSAPGDDALKPDESVGIENPIYDCLNDPQIIISTTNSDSF